MKLSLFSFFILIEIFIFSKVVFFQISLYKLCFFLCNKLCLTIHLLLYVIFTIIFLFRFFVCFFYFFFSLLFHGRFVHSFGYFNANYMLWHFLTFSWNFKDLVLPFDDHCVSIIIYDGFHFS